jgi:hypothetical protein
LLLLLVDGRILEAQKHTNPTDPDEDERGRKKETKKERTVMINTVFLIYSTQRPKNVCPTQKKNFLF